MRPEDIADFRRAIRGHLADRPAVSQSAETIWRAVRREHGGTLAEVETACTVLVTFGQLHQENDPLGGSARYFRITAQGILDHEAGR